MTRRSRPKVRTTARMVPSVLGCSIAVAGVAVGGLLSFLSIRAGILLPATGDFFPLFSPDNRLSYCNWTYDALWRAVLEPSDTGTDQAREWAARPAPPDKDDRARRRVRPRGRGRKA